MKKGVAILCLLLLVVFLGSPLFAGGGEKKEMKVVLIIFGFANEGCWDPAAYQSLLKVKKELPFGLELTEGIAVHDVERIIRSWAARGVDVIWAHSSVWLNQISAVAKNFKDVHFICESQLNPALHMDNPEEAKLAPGNAPPNMILMGETPWEGNYMAGYAAAMMSKTGKLGVVQPFDAPTLRRWTNCFIFGARAVNPGIEIRVVNVGDYVAPAETRDAVRTMVEKGCDVIFSEMDDNSAIAECAALKVYCIPMHIDKSDYNPKYVLTSVIMDWSNGLRGILTSIRDGTFKGYREKHYFYPLNVENHSIYLGKWAPSVPEKVRKAVAELEEKFKEGELKVKVVADKLID